MQSVDNREKITVLVLLAASTMFAVLAGDLQPIAEGGEASTVSSGASGRLFVAASLAGSLIAVLMLLSPGKSHRSLRSTLRAIWPELAGLASLVIGYALILQPLGFFLATTLFLAAGTMLLGERRWWSVALLSAPVAAALEFALSGVFGLALADPLTRALGLTG